MRVTVFPLVTIACAVLCAVPTPEARAQGAPARTTVEATPLLKGEPGMTYIVSPRGQHAAAVALRGSRVVVVHDGVDGPKFDEILDRTGTTQVIFSLDGAHFAYVARLGSEWVVMYDGKEIARGTPWSSSASSLPTVHDMGFAPGGRHVWFVTSTDEPGRLRYKVWLDGRPGPESDDPITPHFSPDGERHTYHVTLRPPSGQRAQALVVDGKPAPYLAGDMQFTGDSKHLFSKRGVPGGQGVQEVLVDGQPFMRAAGVQLHMAPTGPAVLGDVLVIAPGGGSRSHFLTIGNRKVPGSECAGPAGIDKVYFSDDAKHFAVRCNSGPRSFWVMVDGKKGREYESISSAVVFTADGRGVYAATMNNRTFVITGEEESDAYQMVRGAEFVSPGGEPVPAIVSGNHVAYIGRANQQATSTVVVVDGKAIPSSEAAYINYSADGSRLGWLEGPLMSRTLVIDGQPHRGPPLAPELTQLAAWSPRFHMSPDGKHIAYASLQEGIPGRGVALDGKYVTVPEAMSITNITFTPDGRHLLWTAGMTSRQRQQLFVDGERVLEVDRSNRGDTRDSTQWSMGSDGVLTILAADNGEIRRYRITPGSARSVESIGGRTVAPGDDAPPPTIQQAAPPPRASAAGASAPAPGATTTSSTQPAQPPAPARAAGPAATASSNTSSGGAPIDSWSRIRPGQTPREEVERVVGAAQGTQQAFDGQFSVWRGALATRELWLRFTDQGIVREMIVLPARPLADRDLAEILGPSRGKLTTASDGSYEAAYPVAMAVVGFTRTGNATRIVMGPDAIRRAESGALKAKAAEGIKALFGKKKP